MSNPARVDFTVGMSPSANAHIALQKSGGFAGTLSAED